MRPRSRQSKQYLSRILIDDGSIGLPRRTTASLLGAVSWQVTIELRFLDLDEIFGRWRSCGLLVFQQRRIDLRSRDLQVLPLERRRFD